VTGNEGVEKARENVDKREEEEDAVGRGRHGRSNEKVSEEGERLGEER